MLNLTEKQNEVRNIQIAVDEVAANFPKDMEIDPYGPNWAELMEVAAKEKNMSWTVIYRDTDGELKEAWHYLSDMNLMYVQNKYKHQKKEILIFEPMTMDFGRRLASMTGSSRADR
jgi:hypothetical protein